jgi:hypothetical protein
MPSRLHQNITDMRAAIEREVEAGYWSREEIVAAMINAFSGSLEPDAARSIAERVTNEALAAHERQQKRWPAVTDCDRLDAAFSALEKKHILCRPHFSCCADCGEHDIKDELAAAERRGAPARGWVFFSMQETEAAMEDGELWLETGSADDADPEALVIGDAVASALREQGLDVDWDREKSPQVTVDLTWQRRRTPKSDA